MTLKDQLIELSKSLPAAFQPQKDGTLAMEYVVAERKWLLSKKKVTYRCRVRVDDAGRAVRMFEMLKESGFGLSSGSDDIGPGFGFKKGFFREFSGSNADLRDRLTPHTAALDAAAGRQVT